MSPGERASPEVLTSLESPALTTPATKPPSADQANAAAVKPEATNADHKTEAGTKSGGASEQWILKVQGMSDEAVTVELHRSYQPKKIAARFKDAIKDLGPPITGVASALIAALVFYYGNEINKRQAATQEAQAATQRAQADTARNELQLKILSEFGRSLAELSAADSKTKTLAAIRFVQYKDEALPAIRPALGVKDEAIRGGAVTVIVQLFQSGTVARNNLLNSLLQYYCSGNAYERIGILESFTDLDRRLSPDERSIVTKFLKDNLDTGNSCATPEEADVLADAAVLLGLWPSSQSCDLLLAIAKNQSDSCLRPRIQAVDNLAKVAATLSPDRRRSVVSDLNALVTEDADLKGSIAVAMKSIKPTGNQ